MLNYILLERLFFLPEPGQIHVFDKNQTSDIIKHLPTPFLVCSCLSAQAYTPYLVGIDMERSLRRSEPPMPGPPGLRTRRARLMAAWSITSSDFWRWFTGRSRISLKQLTVSDTTNQSVTVLKSVPLPVPVPHRSHSETFTRQISTGPYLYSNFNKT